MTDTILCLKHNEDLLLKTTDPISRTQRWVDDIVIKLNFCPFAQSAIDKHQVSYVIAQGKTMESHLKHLYDQCLSLDQSPNITTCLIIYPCHYQDFDEYLHLLDLSQALLEDQQYDGIYQIASFHPDYQFSGSEKNDVTNYTNRSPYPMIQFIRESTMKSVLKHYPNPENIPDKNMAHCQTLGTDYFKKHLHPTE